MDLQCINCGVQFNYFDRVATIVCDQNHVICKVCADALKKINARCPTCRLPIIGTINYKSPINYNNPTFNNYDRTENLYNQPNPSPYWQSNQNQGFNPQPHSINQPYHGNHPRQAQPYNQGFQPIAPIQRNNVKKFGIAAFICGVAFIVLLVVRLQMDGFDPQTVPIMFGLFISAFLTLVFSCQFINARRQNRMMQIARAGNYMRA